LPVIAGCCHLQIAGIRQPCRRCHAELAVAAGRAGRRARPRHLRAGTPPVRRLASDRFAQRHRKEGKAAFNAEAAQIGARPQADMLTVTEARPPAEAADRLGLADDAEVVVRSRRYLLDGKPVETAVSYIPADLARGTPIADPNPGRLRRRRPGRGGLRHGDGR